MHYEPSTVYTCPDLLYALDCSPGVLLWHVMQHDAMSQTGHIA